MTSRTPIDRSGVEPPSMAQAYLDIEALARSHAAHEGEALMSALMRFQRALADSARAVREEMHGTKSPDRLLSLVNAPMADCLRMGALNLAETSRRAHEGLAKDISNGLTVISSSSIGDVLAWLSIAETTRIAVIVLFEASMLNERAPNGKQIRT